jgi:hypothetical protein
MNNFDEFALRSIAKGLSATIHVPCTVGVADIVTEDEIIEIGTIDEWLSTMERSKIFGNYLNRQPVIMLTGMGSVEEIDAIDDACEEQGVGLYLYNGITLTNIADHWLNTSRDKAMRVAETIATRYGIGARSNDLLKYEKEILDALAEIEDPDSITKILKFLRR